MTAASDRAASAAAHADALPPRLVGTWVPIKVYEADDYAYDPKYDSETFFPEKSLIIAPNRLTFIPETDGHAHGQISHIVNYFQNWPVGTPLQYFGMEPAPGRIDTRVVVLRSRDGIEMIDSTIVREPTTARRA